MLRMVGVREDITICFHCGKRNLKKTIAILDDTTNEVNYYGSECASVLLNVDKRNILKNAEKSSIRDTFLFRKGDT